MFVRSSLNVCKADRFRREVTRDFDFPQHFKTHARDAYTFWFLLNGHAEFRLVDRIVHSVNVFDTPKTFPFLLSNPNVVAIRNNPINTFRSYEGSLKSTLLNKA